MAGSSASRAGLPTSSASAALNLAQNNAAPPLAHAIGGSLGSALALMLLYPLERAKIEMQAQASQRRSSRHNNNNNNRIHSTATANTLTAVSTIQQQNLNSAIDSTHPTLSVDSPSSNESGSYVFVSPPLDSTAAAVANNGSDDDDEGQQRFQVNWDISDHSQVHIESPPSFQQSQRDSLPSPSSSAVAAQVTHNDNNDSKKDSLGLGACLVRLWERGELYRGITPVVSTIGISNFIFFYVNEFMKRLFFASSSFESSTQQQQQLLLPQSKQRKLTLSLLASTLAGVANVLATNPLWVANLRIISGGNRKLRPFSVWLEMVRIAREEGVLQLWNGTLASLLLIANPVIQFFCYDLLKNGRVAYKTKQRLLLSTATSTASTSGMSLSTAVRLAPWEAFLLGAIAKAISTILTYPLQLAQAVLRLQQKGSDNDTNPITADQDKSCGDDNNCRIEYHGTLDCLSKLYSSGGVEGLFTGIKAKLLQTVLTAAFTFLTYEQIVEAIQIALLTHHQQKR